MSNETKTLKELGFTEHKFINGLEKDGSYVVEILIGGVAITKLDMRTRLLLMSYEEICAIKLEMEKEQNE